MKKGLWKYLSLVLMVAMVLSLVACSNPDETSESESTNSTVEEATSTSEPVKIGLVAMLTGDNPLNGERMQQAVQLAIDEYNAAGGILGGREIELLVEDDQTLQDMAVTCVEKLISEEVVGIIGPHRSTNALAVEATVATAGVPTLTGGTSPSISELGNDYLFRIRASDEIFASVAAAYAVDELGAKKIGMLYNSDDYGAGAEKIVAEYCKANGIGYVSEGHNTGDTDFTAQITKMGTEGVDALLIWTHDSELAIHARQIYELGLEAKVVSSPGITMQQVIDMCEPEYIEGWQGVTDYVFTSTDETVQEFNKKFSEKYGINTELYSASYYGAALVLIEAIEAAGTTDRTAVMEALKKTSDLSAPVGVLECDDKNNLVHSVNVAEIINKEPVFIKSISVE